jgi:hypothetical protein
MYLKVSVKVQSNCFLQGQFLLLSFLQKISTYLKAFFFLSKILSCKLPPFLCPLAALHPNKDA